MDHGGRSSDSNEDLPYVFSSIPGQIKLDSVEENVDYPGACFDR